VEKKRKPRKKEMKGLRFNEGKPEWHLLPYDALKEVIKVYMYGAYTKYSPRNWEYGMNYSTVYNCLMRHLTKWWQRDPLDTESRLSHLLHAAFNILALITYEIRGLVQFDDRPKPIYGHKKKKKKK